MLQVRPPVHHLLSMLLYFCFCCFAQGELQVDSIDVFCEKGVFDHDATRRILEAGKAAGMAPNFHGDELHPMGSGELAADVGAQCVSHLEEVSEVGIQAMAASGVVGVVLPTTAYILRLNPPPARKMIEQGQHCRGGAVGGAPSSNSSN